MSDEIRHRLERFIPPESQWTLVDEALYGVEDIYQVEKSKAEELRFEALKYSFEHHYEHNAFYRRYCQGEGVAPPDVKEPLDLTKIPLIPDTFFKDYPTGVEFYGWLRKITTGTVPNVDLKGNNPSFDDVIEALHEQNFTVTFTSGSSGKFSFIPRDELTWIRQRYCFALSLADIVRCEYDTPNPDIVCLSAFGNPEKTHMFTGRVSSAIYGTLFDWKNVELLLNRKLTTDSMRIVMGRTSGIRERVIAKLAQSGRKQIISKFAQKLEGYAKAGRKVLIGGPPFIVDALLSKLEGQGKKLNLRENGWVVTGGGWKVAAGKAVREQDMRERVGRILGIPDERCRDLYGMSECSAFYPGCEGHYKHVPHSFIYPLVLDDELKPLGYGEYGRLALLDPVPASYPGFIITGDRVRILESCPFCDRQGPVIEPDISRVGGVEDRGCAVIARGLVGDKEQPRTLTNRSH